MAVLGAFVFCGGEPDTALAAYALGGFRMYVPLTPAWEHCIEAVRGDTAEKYERYAIRKDTKFDIPYLKTFAARIPNGFVLRRIDEEIYDLVAKTPWATDFIGEFETKERYLSLGIGYVLLKDGEIAAGASSYTRYNEGIEIEIDTREDMRQMGLATVCGAALILDCLSRGLYPSWDAHTKISLALAEKLGYELDRPYVTYIIKEA